MIGHTLVDQAVYLLNAESVRLFGEPLDSEQVEACFDDDQWREMLEDMESRMGFNVAEARYMLASHYVGEEY